MPTAHFLGPFAAVAPLAAAPAGQTPHILPFTMQTQQQSRWCWAAVTASVCQFLGETGDNTRQCKVAGEFLHNECCLNPMPAYAYDWAGNHVYALSTSLYDLGHADDPPSAKLDFESIVQQIDNRKPVCCHIRYPADDDGHFVAIIGYDRNGEKIIVRDPAKISPHNGTFVITQFEAAVGGKWDQSVLIK